MEINPPKTCNGSLWSSRSLDASAAPHNGGNVDVESPARRFIKAIGQYRRVIVIAHNNPDPDAIATGWAIKTFVEAKCPKHAVRFISGGRIARAENQHMVKRLGVPIEMLNCSTEQARIVSDPENAIVLVDCGPAATHHLLAASKRQPTAVIDHHHVAAKECQTNSVFAEIPFVDVRPQIAAAASIAASYLQQSNVRPSCPLATSLVYALKAETRGGENHFSTLDREMLHWLTEFADPALLAEIDDAPLSRTYFLDLLIALQNTTIYGSSAFCMIPHANSSEIVGEVADLLVRCRDVKAVLCATSVGADVLVSVRADEHSGDATQLITQTLKGIGVGGGHRCRAGGKIPGVCLGGSVPTEIEDELRVRWLAATKASDREPSRLVPGPEIIGQLR